MSEELIERLCRACRDGYIEREAEEVLRLHTVMQPCDQLPRLRDELAAERQTVVMLRERVKQLETALENDDGSLGSLRAELAQIADVWEAMWRGKHKEARAEWIVPDMLAWVKEKDAELAASQSMNDEYAARELRLLMRVTKLRESLEPFNAYSISKGASDEDAIEVLVGDLRKARAALRETGGGNE